MFAQISLSQYYDFITVCAVKRLKKLQYKIGPCRTFVRKYCFFKLTQGVMTTIRILASLSHTIKFKNIYGTSFMVRCKKPVVLSRLIPLDTKKL